MADFTDDQIKAWLRGEYRSARTWLNTFGQGARKRPQHEINTKEHKLEMLECIGRRIGSNPNE